MNTPPDMSTQLLRNINVAKEILLDALEAEGLLTRPANEIAKEYMFVLARRGWFGEIIDKIFKGDGQFAWVVKRVIRKAGPDGKPDEPGNRIVEIS